MVHLGVLAMWHELFPSIKIEEMRLHNRHVCHHRVISRISVKIWRQQSSEVTSVRVLCVIETQKKRQLFLRSWPKIIIIIIIVEIERIGRRKRHSLGERKIRANGKMGWRGVGQNHSKWKTILNSTHRNHYHGKFLFFSVISCFTFFRHKKLLVGCTRM